MLIVSRIQCTIYLEGEVVVFLFFLGTQSVPPLPQDLRHRPVVLVRMALMNQRPMAFGEDHEGVHGTPDVVFLLGLKIQRNGL